MTPKLWSATHPLAKPFFSFCLLPTLTMHHSHAQALQDISREGFLTKLPTIHRHWSAEILSVNGLLDIPSPLQPALPIAMLPSPAFESLIAHLGAVLVESHIRRIVSRAELLALQDAVGSSVIDFALRKASLLHAGVGGVGWSVDASLATEIVEMGEGLLAKIFLAAPRAVGQRGMWRLPLKAASSAKLLPLDGEEALRLSVNVLQEIEPAWLSQFTADR